MKPYLIRTPLLQPATVVSGGIRVMYGLYGWLLAKGQIAYINTVYSEIPSVRPAIGIYPEIFNGNDQCASKVIRYILQTPGIMSTGGVPGPSKEEIDATTDKDDIYVFSRVYDQWGVDDDHILFLPIIDLHTFKDKGKKRTKTAFYCARGENLHKHPTDAVEITRDFARDQQALADLLNECHTLYVYDKITAMLEVARLCGCRVEYWGPDTIDALENYEPGPSGITYKDLYEKHYHSYFDIKDFRNHYIGLIKTFEERLDRFIERTQQ